MQVLGAQFDLIEQMFKTAGVDFTELKSIPLDEQFFDTHENLRLVNSFLYVFAKIQDKIGGKLFKSILLELKEIDSESIPLKDVLHILAKLDIIEDEQDWEKLRELRNILSHEYPVDTAERIQHIEFAMECFTLLENIFVNLKLYCMKQKMIS